MANKLLSDSQQEAKERLKAFLLGSSQEFILGGGPGMGKTYLIQTILDEFEGIKNGYEILYGKKCPLNGFTLAATTHPASEELFKSTGFEVKTIHSILNLVPKKDLITGKDYYEINPKSIVPNLSNTLVIIDEASMLVTSIYSVFKNLYSSTTKVIFIMDADQLILPDPDSSYSLDFLQHIVDAGNYVELTQQMRIKNKILSELVEDYREVVRGEYNFFYLEEIKGAIECIDTHNQLLKLIEKLYPAKAGANRYLSVSNSASTAFNSLVRAHIGLPEYFTTDESVILNRSLVNTVNGERRLILPNYSVVNIDKCLGMDTLEINGGRVSLPILRYAVVTPKNEKLVINAIKDFSEYRRILTYAKKRNDWATVQFLEQDIADLRMYGGICGSTIHKAQGASYDYVILDVGDFNSLYDNDFAARALYVAISRARLKVYLLGQLPDRFGGSD